MGATGQEATVQKWVGQDAAAVNREVEKTDDVQLSSLADLTGFPVDFIKKELLLEGDDAHAEKVSLEELRSKMLSYLDKTMKE